MPNKSKKKCNMGPKIKKFIKLYKKEKDTEVLDSCRYRLERVHDQIEKQDTIKLPFRLETPNSKKVYFSRQNGNDTIGKIPKTAYKDNINFMRGCQAVRRCRSKASDTGSHMSKGILKKGTIKSREPSISRLSYRTCLQGKNNLSPSQENSRVGGFNKACRSAFRDIIYHHKNIIQQKRRKSKGRHKRRRINKNKSASNSKNDSLTPQGVKRNEELMRKLRKKKSFLSGRVGFLDDPFLDEVEFDQNGFVVAKSVDNDVSRSSGKSRG